MGFGISNETISIGISNLTDMANVSSLEEFSAVINTNIYAGWLYFTILCVVAVVLYLKFQENNDQPLNNMMYSMAICTIASLVLRAISIVHRGTLMVLLTDFQLWIFPLLASILATAIYMMKDR